MAVSRSDEVHNKRLTKEEQETMVSKIVSGELLIEEAMSKYKIKARRTVVKWLKRYTENINAPHASAGIKEILYLYKNMIDIHERINYLKKQNEGFKEETNILLAQLKELKMKVDVLLTNVGHS